ncbi:helix-turn-helix domain-containing protein [Natrialba swarupiae]|uniref:Bacterio-opsin activator n=1 Tax=Natrialba swarupiae TaxID=2448032 RepID=A0A5D5AMQ4_9EURY|nr:helix-turn-helix domain-containing protein [Natrialba swarupiae]TYT60371.1 bacterio-opsin activator [Natrialba swarupiae]
MRTDRLREFTFTLTYDEGEDPVADVFHSHPNLEALTIDVTTGRTSFVRLVQLRGPPDVADRLQTILEDRDYLPRAIGTDRCCGTSTSYRLECAPRQRLIYAYVEDVCDCQSVYNIVSEHLQRGTIIERRQHDGRERWRLLMRSDEAVGELFEHIETACRDGVTVEAGQLGEATEWHGDAFVDDELTGSQREAVSQAAARGYYERPREVTVAELSAELDVPKSTLSYRLRMAESKLVKRYLGRYTDPESVGGPGN